MAEISLEILDVHDTDDWMVYIGGIYSYINRKPSVTPGIFSRLDPLVLDPIKRRLYYKAVSEYENYSSDSLRYYEIAPSVYIDRMNTVELLNLMVYGKSYTFSYNLLNRLDYCIGCIFDESTNVVRQRLEDRCSKFGITYSDLSFAIMTGDLALMQNINMQLFLNITESLNSHINQIYLHPETFVYAQGNKLISLASQLHTPESRIITFILHKVLFFAQSLLNVIIAQFKEGITPFECSSRCMLLSKGAYNVVFTAKHSDFPDIIFTHKGNTVRLEPQTFSTLGE